MALATPPHLYLTLESVRLVTGCNDVALRAVHDGRLVCQAALGFDEEGTPKSCQGSVRCVQAHEHVCAGQRGNGCLCWSMVSERYDGIERFVDERGVYSRERASDAYETDPEARRKHPWCARYERLIMVPTRDALGQINGVLQAGDLKEGATSDATLRAVGAIARRFGEALGENDGAPLDDGCPRLGLRVLVVDDEPLMGVIMARGLRRCVADIVEAHSGQEALQHVLSAHFDAVFTDYNMPGMNGGELIEAVRTHLGDDAPALILVSGAAHVAHDAATALGVPLVSKPFVISDLVRAMADAAGSERAPH